MLSFPAGREPMSSSRPYLTLPRAHTRSRSLAEITGAPPMLRAHSSPGPDSRGRYIFVNSRTLPLSTGQEPSQGQADDSVDGRLASMRISQTISEHAELDLHSDSSQPQPDSHSTSPMLAAHTFPRIGRRQPSSPLYFHTAAGGAVNGHLPAPPSHSSPPPPVLSCKYNESYPGNSASSGGSSIPSTPTSLRSRSPSISSLETIPDIPDAEAAALEADQIAALKAAADSADGQDAASSSSRRRGCALDVSSSSSSLLNVRTGASAGGYGARSDKRKRWSVCGAERRQDLDLETIWED